MELYLCTRTATGWILHASVVGSRALADGYEGERGQSQSYTREWPASSGDKASMNGLGIALHTPMDAMTRRGRARPQAAPPWAFLTASTSGRLGTLCSASPRHESNHESSVDESVSLLIPRDSCGHGDGDGDDDITGRAPRRISLSCVRLNSTQRLSNTARLRPHQSSPQPMTALHVSTTTSRPRRASNHSGERRAFVVHAR